MRLTDHIPGPNSKPALNEEDEDAVVAVTGGSGGIHSAPPRSPVLSYADNITPTITIEPAQHPSAAEISPDTRAQTLNHEGTKSEPPQPVEPLVVAHPIAIVQSNAEEDETPPAVPPRLRTDIEPPVPTHEPEVKAVEATREPSEINLPYMHNEMTKSEADGRLGRKKYLHQTILNLPFCYNYTHLSISVYMHVRHNCLNVLCSILLFLKRNFTIVLVVD